MVLPSTSEIAAATRNIAAGVAMAIGAFGLSTKIDPATVSSVIYAGGQVIGDVLTFVALVTPLVTAFYAWRSKTPKAQAADLTKVVPGTVVVTTAAIAAATPNSPNVVSHDTAQVISK